MMPSATDFLPSYIRLFMNFASTRSPNLASGMISRFSARRRRAMGSIPFPSKDPGTRFARPGCLSPRRKSLWPFCSVYRAALLSVLHALRIEHAAENVIAHARQVLDAAATDQHDGMFLQIVAFPRNVAHDLIAVGEPDLGHLAQRGVRLLRRCRIDARTNPPLLRAIGKRRHFVALWLFSARLADQLIDRRHSLCPFPTAAGRSQNNNFSGPPFWKAVQQRGGPGAKPPPGRA